MIYGELEYQFLKTENSCLKPSFYIFVTSVQGLTAIIIIIIIIIIISVFFVIKDDPVVWRGPKKTAMIKQFLTGKPHFR